MSDFTYVYEKWVEALRAAWTLARGERLGELRGSRPPRFDAQGVHPYSQEWGRILAYEALEPVLGNVRFGGEPFLTPVGLRKLAHAEATAMFRDELLGNREAEK